MVLGAVKVIHVVRALETGGLELLTLELCTRLGRRGDVEAAICELFPGDGIADRPEYEGLQITTLPGSAARTRAGRIRALTDLFRREKPDVVHLHNFLPQVYGGAAARLARVPAVVATKHGRGWPSLGGSRRLAGCVYQLADAIVAVSADARQGLLTNYGLAPGRVRHIMNGIDTERFRPATGDRRNGVHGIPGFGGAPLIGTVCRLLESKGIRTLLDAFVPVVAELPEARLAIVGDGPDRGGFEDHALELGLCDRVFFAGMRDDVDALYPLLDVFALPSHTEGISLTLLEAASCALPIVATAVGGSPEIIDHDRTGLLVPPRDSDALAEALIDQWRRRERAREMGRAARAEIVKRFSLERMTGDYLALYHEVLNGRAVRHTEAGE